MRIAYHLGPGALPQLVKTLLYTVVLIATIALTPDADVRGRPAATLRRGQLRPALVLGGAVGEAAVPGGGGGRVFRPVLPVRPVSGRPPALAEHLARHYGGPGAWLALNWLYSTYVENFADYSLLYGSIGTAIAL